MKKLGKELDFISRILRDGSGTEDMSGKDLIIIGHLPFKITCLSITNGTYIASGFNSYVVKLKK